MAENCRENYQLNYCVLHVMITKLRVQGNLRCSCEQTVRISGEMKEISVISKEAVSLSSGSVPLGLPEPVPDSERRAFS